MVEKVVKKIKNIQFERDFLKGSALISFGTAFAQVLGLAFSIVIAEAFPSQDYGRIQVFIALSAFVAIVTQPFGQHTVSRFVGKYKHNPEKLQIVLSNTFLIMVILFIVSLVVAIPTLLLMEKSSIGIFVIFFGITIFYSYWGLTTGFMEAKKLTLAYIGSNLVQIIVVLVVVYVLNIRSITVALIIYGLSYLLPLTLLQIFSPLDVKLIPGHFNPQVIREILNFSFPIWISHASYVGFFNIDILLIERFVSSQELGAFALTRTLTAVFGFVPTGIASLLMPKIASDNHRGNLNLFKRVLVISLIGNLLIFIAYVFTVEWVTINIFGTEYSIELIVSVLMALSVISQGVYKLFVSYLVGTNRPGAESIGRIFSVVTLLAVGLMLMPELGALGAAIAKLLAIVIAILISYLASKRINIKIAGR